MPPVRYLVSCRSLPSMRSAQVELGGRPSENRSAEPARSAGVKPPRLSGRSSAIRCQGEIAAVSTGAITEEMTVFQHAMMISQHL